VKCEDVFPEPPFLPVQILKQLDKSILLFCHYSAEISVKAPTDLLARTYQWVVHSSFMISEWWRYDLHLLSLDVVLFMAVIQMHTVISVFRHFISKNIQRGLYY